MPNHSKESAVTTDTIPKVKREVVTFGEPSVIKPHASKKSLLGKDASSDVFANWQTPNINVFNPDPHLEAYSIHPLVETTNLVSKLSYNLESLRLDEGVMKAQVQSLGSDYSVMDALLDLEPQLLNLIQYRAAQRQGNIVSVKHGKAFDLSTAMGLLQVKPIVFIISTTTMLPQDSTPMPAQLTNPANSFFKPATGQGTFTNLAPTPDFGFSKSKIAESYLSSPEAYSRHLQEQGEPCTYVEANEAQSLQHYQTITADKKWHNQDRSLEEIRLADYRAGRQGMVRTKAVLSPWQSAPVRGAPVSNGFSQSALPITTEYSKTGWFPATKLPFNSGHAFDRAPSKGSPSTLDANTSPEHLPKILGTAGPSRGSVTTPGSFSPLAPTLPQQGLPSRALGATLSPPSSNAWDAWVSSRASSDQPNMDPFSGGPKIEPVSINKMAGPIFGHPTRSLCNSIYPAISAEPAYITTTNSEGICTRQHHHGPFSQTQHPPNKESFFATATSANPSTSARVTSTIKSTPKPGLFGSDVATNTSMSPFGAPKPSPSNQMFPNSIADQSADPQPTRTTPVQHTLPGGTATGKAPSATTTLPGPPAIQQLSPCRPFANTAPRLGPEALRYSRRKRGTPRRLWDWT